MLRVVILRLGLLRQAAPQEGLLDPNSSLVRLANLPPSPRHAIMVTLNIKEVTWEY